MLITVLAALAIASCDSNKKILTKTEQVQADNITILNTSMQNLQRGDLVLRLGNDVISQILADLNPHERKYSHCGLLDKQNGQWVVININPKSTRTATDDTMRAEPLDTFLSPYCNKAIAIHRYALAPEMVDKVFNEVYKYQQQKPHFDNRFNLADDSLLYCSELIAKSVEKATEKNLTFERAYMKDAKVIGVKRYFNLMSYNADLSKYPVITLDNLYLNKAKKIYEGQYKRATDY